MKKVAIVEDDPIMSLLLEEVCKAAGYQVVGSLAAAHRALPMLERECPDYLLIDFKLSGRGTGLDLIEQVKQRWPTMATIMITGWDINDIARQMHAAQPDRILRKPIQPDTLVSVMESLGQDARCLVRDRV